MHVAPKGMAEPAFVRQAVVLCLCLLSRVAFALKHYCGKLPAIVAFGSMSGAAITVVQGLKGIGVVINALDPGDACFAQQGFNNAPQIESMMVAPI
jgi:hypothetical protein